MKIRLIRILFLNSHQVSCVHNWLIKIVLLIFHLMTIMTLVSMQFRIQKFHKKYTHVLNCLDSIQVEVFPLVQIQMRPRPISFLFQSVNLLIFIPIILWNKSFQIKH